MNNKLINVAFFGLSSLALTACGGGSNFGSTDTSTGTLNLAITDAPVDDAKSVVVEFNGLELKPSVGENIVHDFKDASGNSVAKSIDLLALTNGKSKPLLDGLSLKAGHYDWIRLKVNAEKDVEDTYITLKDDSVHEMEIPSGNQSGLKLQSGFNVPAGGSASFTIDFDLRKSVHKPKAKNKDYILRPTLRLVDNSKVGKLTGSISSELVTTGGECTGAVYVFNETDAVDDFDGENDAISSANISSENGSDNYTVAFLSEGKYKVAFTCDAGKDDPEKNDEIIFHNTTVVTIEAGKTATYDFK
ncbi:MAG: DUF4382 domain-containing protein [Cocleimonas sp.]